MMKSGAEALVKNRKQSGLAVSDQVSSAMDMNQIKSRLGDSALRKMQQSAHPFASQPDLSNVSSKQ